MQRTAARRAGLVVAPLLLAAAGAVATATPASADCTNVVSCTVSDKDGNLHAGVSYITVSVKGGNYASKGGTVEIPRKVPPPCWYSKGQSAAELYAESKDPYYYGLAHHVGENHDDWYGPEVAEHKDDDGYWYSWQCNSVRMPTVNFNPAARSFVRLDTWMWFDPAAWQPVSVTASGGGNSVTVTATPGKVGVSGVPAGSIVLTGCTGGGRPYSPGGATDCMINFSRSSGAEPGQQWHFQVSLTWNVTAVGATLQGPPTITRTEDEALTVLEAQTVAGNPGD